MRISLTKLNETSLHQALKSLYRKEESIQEEVPIEINGQKYRIDLLDEKSKIVYEIQRAGFGGKFSKKVLSILDSTVYRIRIVHPIVYKEKVTRMQQEKQISVTHRKYNTSIYHLFENLVRFKVPYHERLEFDILLIYEHKIKEFIGYYRRSGRRRYQTMNRDLLEIIKVHKIRNCDDFLSLLPKELPHQFTNRDLSQQMYTNIPGRRNKRIPGMITYSLCQLGLLKRVGKQGNAYLFQKQELS
jgi:hypothetical protein